LYAQRAQNEFRQTDSTFSEFQNMSDNSDDDSLLGWGDAYAVGEKIVEMCDRVKKLDKVAPGVQAKWVIGIEDDEFEVVVQKKKQNRG
jgi:hypothetical protein